MVISPAFLSDRKLLVGGSMMKVVEEVDTRLPVEDLWKYLDEVVGIVIMHEEVLAWWWNCSVNFGLGWKDIRREYLLCGYDDYKASEGVPLITDG
ncbi:hypothetical protein ACLOJK_004731 [Asimina triloba]